MPVNRIKEIMKAKNAPGIFHCDSEQSFGKLNLCNDADVITAVSYTHLDVYKRQMMER